MPTLDDFALGFLEQHAGKLKPGTLANYRSLLNTHIAPRDQRGILKPACLGRLRLDQVTHQEIAALHRQMRKTPRAANHVLAFLSSLFSEAQAANLVPEGVNPTRRVKRYAAQPRQRFLTEIELARVGEALNEAQSDGSEDPYALAAIRLLILTGCRRDEILGARWNWVDFDRGLLNLPDSKTGAKPVHLSPAAVEVLKALPRVEDNPFIIVGKRAGQRWINLRKVWVRIRERADLQPDTLSNGKVQQVRIHDLRHSFASLLATGGASLPMIGKLLGHTNPQTTARYAHLADDPLRQLNADVGNLISAALIRHGRRV
jgi:integrase